MGTLNMLGLAKRVRVRCAVVSCCPLRVSILSPGIAPYNCTAMRAYQQSPLATFSLFLGSFTLSGVFVEHRSPPRAQARFLLSSTSEVYGDPLQHPQTEARPAAAPPPGHRAVLHRPGPPSPPCSAPPPRARRKRSQCKAVTCTGVDFSQPLPFTCFPQEYWGNVNPIGERSCYDEGKRVAETLAFDYHREHGVEVRGPVRPRLTLQ